MMNQGIGSILDSINQAQLQYVAAEQVKPIMQQISQALAPLGGMQNQPRPAIPMMDNFFNTNTMPNPSSSDATNNAALARPLTQDVYSPSSFSMSDHPAFSGPTPLADRVVAIPGMPQVDPAPEKIGIGSLLQ